ncbi:MAG: RHS repeat-associated core domain-containing protein, partial [Bacteroidia bacterium]|nr:RHS repeat-associated core domain-containing protein [Bacteroidia bacterium]
EGNYSREGGNFKNSYLETMNYDKNGNIRTMYRNGDNDDVNYEFTIDNLFYTYDSENKNQLKRVFDASNSPQGFKDDSDGFDDPEDDYQYDANGNLTKDANKKIQNITYNHSNLPVHIVFETGEITYLYNAAGQKLQKSVEGSETITTEYLTGFQYHNQALNHFAHAEGYVDVVEGKFKYVFNYTDHLGNIRMSYSDADDNSTISENEILEENHYYPFGLKHSAYNTQHQGYIRQDELNNLILQQMPKFAGDGSYNYKYNGKEFQDELGLNMYDYGARNYDPALGRWMNIDNLSENNLTESPYTYCGNNPIIYKDPDGNDKRFFDIHGEEIVSKRVVSDKVFESHIAKNDGNNSFTSVPMPKIIQTRKGVTEEGDDYENDVSGSEYQENDYLIAARTGLFNQSKNEGLLTLYTDGGDLIPADVVKSIPDLNPTLVKAVAMQESNVGADGVKDIMTANNNGDSDKYKLKYGLTKGTKVGTNNSLYYGIRFLATKGFKGGIKYNSSTGKKTYKFQGWFNAAGNYNGGGEENYQWYIEEMYKNAEKPTPSNY